MGVFEETSSKSGMHWQHHEQYIGPAYDPSRDLSPNLPPSSDSSMGDADHSVSSGSSCSTPLNNNSQQLCSTAMCRTSTCVGDAGHQLLTSNSCRSPSSFDQQIPKLEPLAAPDSPNSPSCMVQHGGTVCAGCRLLITDRFYLQAVDRRWHAGCLQCCQCRNTLDGEITCFSREGNIYCKKDYYRLFGMKRCARCQAAIVASELVMRARELVFHVRCFMCAICNSPLTKGDQYGMRDGAVFCRLHFEMPHPNDDGSTLEIYSPAHPFPSPDFHLHHRPHPPHLSSPATPGNGASEHKASFFNGTPTAARQKGRPRKRKPKDIEGIAANLDLNTEYLDITFGRSPGTPGLHSSSQRTKRMRTSFKHHQLRTMKSYFAINHNPDAKDLKQLSQKTGLPKRVLQVWFQNARAKWRRMMLKQEGKSGGDKCSMGDSISDMDLYPHGPASMASSIQSINPHSPPFILPPPSPSSLDCS